MPDAVARFSHQNSNWSDRAYLGALRSVLDAGGSERMNVFLHASTLVGAQFALRVAPKESQRRPTLLDFGCGTGRMLRFFASKGWSVIGTEITEGMLSEARRFGLPDHAQLCLTDGVSIPVADSSVDLVWVCGVLKYTLFEPDSLCRGGRRRDRVAYHTTCRADTARTFIPAYREIATEMYRVLKPGGVVVNVEMCVDAFPSAFLPDFEDAGFISMHIHVTRRWVGRYETFLQWHDCHHLPLRVVLMLGQCLAKLRFWFDNPWRPGGGMRDYVLVWAKPEDPRRGAPRL